MVSGSAVAKPMLRRRMKTLYHRIRAFALRGDKFLCPVCGRSFRRFLPGGVENRPGAKCPGCSSLERHRLLWLFLQNRTDLFSARLSVLHFAPEPCFRSTLERLRNLAYTTADLIDPDVDIQMDITDIKFPDESFDVILCSHVLEHVPDDFKAMAELRRVLKPRGWALLEHPIDPMRDVTYEDPAITSPEDRKRHFFHPGHVRVYGRDYPRRLEQSGFRVEVIPYAQTLAPDVIARNRLGADDIYLCTKGLPGEQPAPTKQAAGI
jgi:hypothetical protein